MNTNNLDSPLDSFFWPLTFHHIAVVSLWNPPIMEALVRFNIAKHYYVRSSGCQESTGLPFTASNIVVSSISNGRLDLTSRAILDWQSWSVLQCSVLYTKFNFAPKLWKHPPCQTKPLTHHFVDGLWGGGSHHSKLTQAFWLRCYKCTMSAKSPLFMTVPLWVEWEAKNSQ